MTIRATLERVDENKVRLDIEVPETIVRNALDHTLVHLGARMEAPGFRRGKMPRQMVLARVGREAAVAEAINEHLEDWYSSAVAIAGIQPVAAPDIDFENLPDEDHTFRFSATVEVAPKPKLPDLSQLEVPMPKQPDTSEYVDNLVDATLQGAGTLEPTNAPAAEGDEVLVDFECVIGGEPVRGASARAYEAQLGGGRLLTELEKGLLGKSAGDDIEVPVTFPADHPMEDLAGKEAVFQVKLREVSRLKSPEPTDEVIKKVSEYDTADQLRGDIEHTIRSRIEGEAEEIFRSNAVEKLADAAEVREPDSFVERRKNELFVGVRRQLEQRGMTIEAYLGSTGRSHDELFEELDQQARVDVRRELCLLALAEQAEIEISDDDLRDEIRRHVQVTGEDENAAVERVFSSAHLDLLRRELMLQRAVDYLVSQVVPVEQEIGQEQGDDAQEEGAVGVGSEERTPAG